MSDERWNRELNNPQFLMALLALEQKLISQDELLIALRTWLANPSKPLSEILMEQAGVKAELASVFQQHICPADLTRSLLQSHEKSDTSSLDGALGENSYSESVTSKLEPQPLV